MTTDRRLLVIDDDALMRELIADIADASGYAATTTSDPSSLESDALAGVDVIVLDMLMPGFDGIETIRLLARHKTQAGLILVSGLDQRTLDTARKIASSQGLKVHGSLTKPFRNTQLSDLLKTARTVARSSDASSPRRSTSVDEETLARALHEGQFVLHYQPQVSLEDGHWFGIEGLARWQHPEHGLLYPDSFIKAVENGDLALPFTLAMLRRGIADCMWLKESADFSGQLSINVPPRALNDVVFTEEVLEILEQSGFPPSRLTLEITETSLPKSETVLLDILVRLRMRGIGLSIDDFGTGHSGYERLRDSPFDELKIDMVFVRDTEQHAASQAIVDSAITLGHRLEMKVLAEGVETEIMLQRLKAQGCDAVQGYLIGRPQERERLLAWSSTRSKAPA